MYIKMKKAGKVKLWDETQENMCGFCIFAGKIPNDDDNITCTKKKKVFEFTNTCKKFKFDILKKDVRRAKVPDFSKFSAENFQL